MGNVSTKGTGWMEVGGLRMYMLASCWKFSKPIGTSVSTRKDSAARVTRSMLYGLADSLHESTAIAWCRRELGLKLRTDCPEVGGLPWRA